MTVATMYDKLVEYLGDYAEDTALTRRVLRSAVDEAAERAEDDGEDLTVDGVRAVLVELVSNDGTPDALIYTEDAAEFFEELKNEILPLLRGMAWFADYDNLQKLIYYAADSNGAAGAAGNMAQAAYMETARRLILEFWTVE